MMQTSPLETASTVKRPTSVTVISWILIGTAIAGLVSTFTIWILPMSPQIPREGQPPVLLSALTTFFMAVKDFVLGVALLKGRNWGRPLYIVLEPASIVFSGIVFGFFVTTALPVALYLVALFFLTRPRASAFFHIASSTPIAASPSTEKPIATLSILKKLAAITLFGVAGMWLLPVPMVLPFFSGIEEGDWQVFIALTTVFAGLMIASLAGGMAFWGWRRWRQVLGIIFCVDGGFLLFLAVMLPLGMLDPQLKDSFNVANSQNTPDIWGNLVWGAGIGGSVFMALGLVVLKSQSHLDKKQAPTPA